MTRFETIKNAIEAFREPADRDPHLYGSFYAVSELGGDSKASVILLKAMLTRAEYTLLALNLAKAVGSQVLPYPDDVPLPDEYAAKGPNGELADVPLQVVYTELEGVMGYVAAVTEQLANRK